MWMPSGLKSSPLIDSETQMVYSVLIKLYRKYTIKNSILSLYFSVKKGI